MNSTGVIYGLIDSDTGEIRYVGQTTKLLEERFARHMRTPRRRHLYNWLRSCSPKAIILERVPIKNLNDAEVRWIANMRERGVQLVNLTDGGECIRGYRPTPETRVKLSAALMGNQRSLGYKHTSEARAKIGAASKGRTHNPETRAKISKANMGNQRCLGRIHSPETRAKISAAKIGRKVRRTGSGRR